MDMTVEAGVIKQHLIDPEICIRCNTCEATCPVGAITHDERNYVVKADVCNGCMACVPPCPTGSIDNWRTMPLVRAYSIEEQLGWDELPPELTPEQLAAEGVTETEPPALTPSTLASPPAVLQTAGDTPFNSAQYGSTVPPWSAARPYTNLFTPKKSTTATTEKAAP